MSDSKPTLTNPRVHDSLFKWLIGRYTYEFFQLFFPHVKTEHIHNADKEFIQQLEESKASVQADLLLAMKAEVEGRKSEMIIVLEFKSKKEDAQEQIQTYFAHALNIYRKPVWAIVLFTDDDFWEAPDEYRIPIAFSSREGFIDLVVDVIKLKGLEAEKLSRHQTLLAKLLALKADDRSLDRKQLVQEIYLAAKAMGENIPDDINLLIQRFIKQYGRLPTQDIKAIQEAVDMIEVASTITEHYELRGKREGKILGRIEMLEDLKENGLITEGQFNERLTSLQAELEAIKKENELDNL